MIASDERGTLTVREHAALLRAHRLLGTQDERVRVLRILGALIEPGRSPTLTELRSAIGRIERGDEP